MSHWTILGIHPPQTSTERDQSPRGTARVRFHTGEDRKIDFLDESIPLPALPPTVNPSLVIYQALLTVSLDQRLAELTAPA